MVGLFGLEASDLGPLFVGNGGPEHASQLGVPIVVLFPGFQNLPNWTHRSTDHVKVMMRNSAGDSFGILPTPSPHNIPALINNNTRRIDT